MRNADHDLKICNAATRGPWYREKTGATFKGFSTETIIADTAPYCTKNRIYADAGDSYPASDADFIALSREALPYWIKRAQELEKVLCGYEQWEADLLMDDQAWSSGLPCFTQGLYDKWMELQEQRNEALREEKSEND